MKTEMICAMLLAMLLVGCSSPHGLTVWACDYPPEYRGQHVLRGVAEPDGWIHNPEIYNWTSKKWNPQGDSAIVPDWKRCEVIA